MTMQLRDKLKAFGNNRWLVFVCSIWVQSCAGVGYMFGSISPVIKTTMGYNQRQLAMLGVAKDLGDSLGFLAGALCEVLPVWGILLIGAVQNFLGYGLVWLVVSQNLPALPLWVMCISIFVGTNGETYFNTGALVSCIQNFPKRRGPIVGILKGYAGLSGAILAQIYAMINSPNEASLIFMVAIGPSMVIISLMFIVRPVGGYRQVRPYDNSSFLFTYIVCLLLAAYLIGVLLLEDLVGVEQNLVTVFTVLLLILIILPVVIPILLVFFSKPRQQGEESLLPGPSNKEEGKIDADGNVIFLSEVEEEKSEDVDLLPPSERKKRISHLQAKLLQAAADGAVRLKRRKGPRIGEDFTLTQALAKADLWLIFFSLVIGAGTGVTVIDNLGQICESLGYNNTRVYVSMISIWNFLGRVVGGYFSEIIVKNYAYPRIVTMAVFQVIMAAALLYCTMSLPGEIYVLTVLIGLGYGSHWAIMPATASELFGLKSFGALYNFLTMAIPAGSLIFSGVIASNIYEFYAEKQAALQLDEIHTCHGSICYSLTFGILSGLCIVAMILSLIVVHRTKRVYIRLYGIS